MHIGVGTGGAVGAGAPPRLLSGGAMPPQARYIPSKYKWPKIPPQSFNSKYLILNHTTPTSQLERKLKNGKVYLNKLGNLNQI